MPFERFITLDRILKANTPPDIDSDFSDKELVMKHRKEKYGDRIAALSINTNMKLKNSIKDGERAIYGKVRPETNTMCFSFPGIPQGISELQWLFGYEDKETGDHVPGFWEQSDVLRDYASNNSEVWKIVVECLGVMRNKGSHPCGVLIAPTAIHNYFPLTWIGTKNDGQLCVGFDPRSLEWAGGMKYDFLGVKTLKTIEIAMKLIKERYGITLEWREYDHSDAVYEKIFHTGDTLGVFQYGTPTVIPYVKKIKPRNTKDLSNITALCRPGTLEAPAPDGSGRTCAEYYIAVAQGEKPYYIHPDMRSILEETNGICLFQEQFLKTLVFSGLTLAEAEAGRRAVAKKKKEDLQKIIGGLKTRLMENKGWTQAQVDLLGEQLIASSRYSFNKAHSQSYAIVGYNTAWLKYFYPLEFYIAELTCFADKKEKYDQYISLLRDRILMPSISNSKPDSWSIEGDKLRAPLNAIKGVDKCAKIIAANAPYTSVLDFTERCKDRSINRGVFIKLVLFGLFDEISTDRDSMIKEYWKIKKVKDPIPDDCINLSRIESFVRTCQLNSLTKERLCDMVMDSLSHIGFIPVAGIPSIPMMSSQKTPLLADVPAAIKVTESSIMKDKEFFLVGLFQGSAVETTKTGKQLLKVKLTDGTTDYEAIHWTQLQALRFPKNTVVLVKGKIKKGWKVPVSITYSTIETIK